jgi:uncharacterized membrane protein YccC
MTSPDVLARHLELCDDLHALALEENHFLKTEQQAPKSTLIERRRALLERLDESLAALRPSAAENIPTDPAARERRKAVIEKARTRILQILHLQRENEQLVLRYSVGASRPVPVITPPPATQLQKLYDRHR